MFYSYEQDYAYCVYCDSQESCLAITPKNRRGTDPRPYVDYCTRCGKLDAY